MHTVRTFCSFSFVVIVSFIHLLHLVVIFSLFSRIFVSLGDLLYLLVLTSPKALPPDGLSGCPASDDSLALSYVDDSCVLTWGYVAGMAGNVRGHTYGTQIINIYNGIKIISNHYVLPLDFLCKNLRFTILKRGSSNVWFLLSQATLPDGGTLKSESLSVVVLVMWLGIGEFTKVSSAPPCIMVLCPGVRNDDGTTSGTLPSHTSISVCSASTALSGSLLSGIFPFPSVGAVSTSASSITCEATEGLLFWTFAS